jgi:hypothetical protein
MTYVGVQAIAPPLLTSTVDGGERAVSRPCRSTPGETAPLPVI